MVNRAIKTLMSVALIMIFILSNVVVVISANSLADDSEVPTQGIIGLKQEAFEEVVKKSGLVLEPEELPFRLLPLSEQVKIMEEDYQEVVRANKEAAEKARKEKLAREEAERKAAAELAKENALKQAKKETVQVNNNTGGNIIKAYPHSDRKTYMAWHMCAPGTPQYNIGAASTPDPETNIMVTSEGRYLAAVGFAYASHIGQNIDVVMQDGSVIPITVGDFKAKAHTDQWNSASLNNGDIIEFIVNDYSVVNQVLNGMGSYHLIFPGLVDHFVILD